MKELDYEKLGLRCGLEIHQQIDTKKLFCNCPSILRQGEPDFTVKRKLHVVAGESGEIDVAAAYQASLDKEFIYQGYDTTCLVELDEEPPHEINKEALKIALQIAVLLNAKIFPLTQIMRKTVINGSNTSGFQRTVLIAREGYIETEKGKIKVDSICLEEDAARPVGKKDGTIIYRLDRLGIPLVEVATAPDIKSPSQAKEIALCIGDILRSCKVKRGLGTIRQDVNLSINGGKRVEIKGFQDIRNIGKTIENEVKRQIELVKKNKSICEVRNVLPDATTEFLRPLPGAARMYPETDVPLLKISRNLINRVKKNLPKLRSEIEKELKKKGLNPEMIKLLFKQNKLEEFRMLLDILNQPMLVAKSLLIYPTELAKKIEQSQQGRKKITDTLNNSLEPILMAVKKRKILANQVKEVMKRVVRGLNINQALKIEKQDLNVIEEKIMKMIKDKPGLSSNAYMGLVMKEFGGKISGKEAMEIIKKYVE